jgi:hypothetical protein
MNFIIELLTRRYGNGGKVKPIIKYSIIATIVLAALYYFFDSSGLLMGLFGSSAAVITGLKKKGATLDAKADVVKEDLKVIEEEKRVLKEDGVTEMTPEEEAEYWKNQ